jgi:hypothetical protein
VPRRADDATLALLRADLKTALDAASARAAQP